MMILQQVEIVFFFNQYFQSIVTRTVWLMHKYKAHIKGFPMCLRKVQDKNNIRDNKFVTTFEGECRIIIELREYLELCFLVILG